MPGLVSETYLRPADSAASFGSTIVCTSAADSNKAITSSAQSKNLLNEREFHGHSPPAGHAGEAGRLSKSVGFPTPDPLSVAPT
jgi:hypothetical protein